MTDDLRARIAEALAECRTLIPTAQTGAVMAVLDEAQRLNDDAWGSVWLHGKWSWLTKCMTTPERELAADCVARWSARLAEIDGDLERGEPEGLRWWREPARPACTCRGLPMGAGESCNAHQMKETR